jgi:hypothetical protein
MDWIAAPRHGVLVGGRDRDREQPGQRVSTDGGRTWRTVRLADEPVPAVPAGSYVDLMRLGDTGKLVAVDPRTGRAAPLASQPGFTLLCVEADPAQTVLVATGYQVDGGNESTRLAVSRDGGRTWSTHPLPVGYFSEPPSTADGITLYLVGSVPEISAGEPHEMVQLHPISFSTDGGATWTGRDVEDGYFVRTGFVTTDGAHVAVSSGLQEHLSYWVSRDKGATYQRRESLPGLPASNEMMYQIVPGTGAYVAWTDGSTTFYRSTDGWNWSKVTIR